MTDLVGELIEAGNALSGQDRFVEALACYDRAAALDPRDPYIHLNRGITLQALLRYGEAVAAYDRALALAPHFAPGWSDRGLALQHQGQLDEAIASFRHAQALDPALAAAPLHRGLCHLLMQDFATGLPLYEWRKQMPQPKEARVYPQPLWNGVEDIRGKTLFCYIEQGLGDAIQYYRFVRFALDRGARVILSVQTQLIELLKRAQPRVELIGWGAVPPVFDFHIPLASIPLAVGMTAQTIPAADHYLTADPARIAHWKQAIGGHGYRIGVAWQGLNLLMGSEGKAFPLAALAPIAAISGVRLIGLQKNAGSEQLNMLPPGMMVERYDFDNGPDAFLDTAAMMMACDLVISADTAPAHLAGALGVKTWLALKHVPDWRWFLQREDSPWYPSLRLFRQPVMGDWASVFAAMARELTSRPLISNKP
ncbi:MAG: tetratricopeptide repeat protein [Alphaproteobacteria bacterium]